MGITSKGKPKRKSLYGRSRQEVAQKATKALAARQEGMLADPQGYTLGSYLKRWLDIKEPDIEETTYNAYRCALAKLEPLYRVKLDQVNPLDVKQIYADIIRSGLSARTAQITHSTLYSAIKDAATWRLLPRNFMDDVKRPRSDAPEVKFWSQEEIVSFLDHTHSHRLYALFYVALCTGLRRGELIALRWKDVLWDDDGTARIQVVQNAVAPSGHIKVKRPKTKSSTRMIGIAEDVAQELRRHQQRQEEERILLGRAWHENGLVFPSEVGTYLQPRNLSRTFETLISKLELTKVGLHGLRHTHASLLIKEGADARTVSERLGHTDVAFTLRVYQHLFEEQRKQAAIGLAHLLGKQK